MSKSVFLNATAIRNRIKERALRQWWIAEQLKMDRKTLSRWVSGAVRKTDLGTATALADLLDVELNAIIVEKEEELFASPEDQKQAAELLQSTQLIDKLAPIGEWDVLEKLLKATLVPNLPKSVLGEMYNQLAITCWRQNKIEDARRYAFKGKEIGQSTGDDSILAHAYLNLANIYSWDGAIKASLDTYHRCIGLETFLGPRKTGSAYNNISAVCWEIGDLDSALKYVDSALECFASDGRPMNFSIAHAQKASVLMEMNRLSEAREQIDLAIAHGINGTYQAGVGFGKLLLSQWMALNQEPDKVLPLVQEGLSAQSDSSIMAHLHYEIAVRACRTAGLDAEAAEYIKIGLGLKTDHEFPVAKASLHKEAGIFYLKTGDSEKGRKLLEDARAYYLKIGASLRLKEVHDLLQSVANP